MFFRIGLHSVKLLARVLLFSVSATVFNLYSQTGERPNILFIMSDDHAYQAISCYGDSLVKTPNIDRLADAGLRFENSFVTNSICSPSRAVMLTGTYSHINGLVDNYRPMDTSLVTFPKLLQNAGYQTAVIGKWHLKSRPQGFDYYNVLPDQGYYYNPIFVENGVKVQDSGYVTDIITEKALNWLESVDTKKPFCLLLHHKAVHRNWMPPVNHINTYSNKIFDFPESYFDDYNTRGSAASNQEMEIRSDMLMAYDLKNPGYYNGDTVDEGGIEDWYFIYNRLDSVQKKIWDHWYAQRTNPTINDSLSSLQLERWKYNRYMQDYLACVSSLDENIGEVIDYLEEKGLIENTIVIYTSDQGFYLGEHGWFDKRFIYEQSLRTPLIISYKNQVKNGTNNSALVTNLDYAPTLLDFAGVAIPDIMQGLSLKNLITGKDTVELRDAIYYRYYEYPSVHMVKRHYGIRTHRYKLIHFYYDDDYWELYDLKNDPSETNNLYNKAQYSEIVENLKNRLKELQHQYNDTEGDLFLPPEPIAIYNMAKGAKVYYSSQYSKKYTAGGDSALVDGLVADSSVNTIYGYSGWQGFSADDLEVIIDMNHHTNVSGVECGFLHKPEAWVFMPENVSLYVSDDTIAFRQIGKFETQIEWDSIKTGKQSVVFKDKDLACRYLKIKAENIGTCPASHIGEGKNAWLMCDEIIVK